MYLYKAVYFPTSMSSFTKKRNFSPQTKCYSIAHCST